MVPWDVPDCEEARDHAVLGMIELHELTVGTKAVVCLVSQSGTVGSRALGGGEDTLYFSAVSIICYILSPEPS